MDETVSEKLFVCLSKFIANSSLKEICIDLLEIPHIRLSQIQVQSSDAEEQKLQLLLAWHRTAPKTNGELLNLIVHGIIRNLIAQEALQAVCEKAQLAKDEPKVKELFEKLEASRRSQICLSSFVQKSRKFQNIQNCIKQSFRAAPFNLAVHSEWSETPRVIKLNDIYTDLQWIQIHRNPCNVLKQEIDGYWQILAEKELGNGPVRILVDGEAGIGKTTFTHILAIEWATRKRKELNKFDLVFVIPLRDVKPHHKIEDLVIMCHRGLKAKKVTTGEIKEMLNDDEENKILIVMDGYDEYTPGTNTEIDDALKKLSLWNSWIIITSRPSEDLNELRQYIDAEAKILGFTEENIFNYASKFLQNDDSAKKLLAKARERKIIDILKIPIMLQMVCELFVTLNDLPETKTEIVASIFRFCLERASKRCGISWTKKEMDVIMYRLGKLSWKSLRGETRQLLLEKDEVITALGESILKTGLLLTAEDVCSSARKYLTFQHKILQEYAAAYYLCREYNGNAIELQKLFPTLRSMTDFSVVLQFLCGQSEDMSKIVMDICCSVVARSFANNLGEVQCLFSVDWLIDERAYLSQINHIMPAYTIMSWADAVAMYLQTIFETIRNIQRECKSPSSIKSFNSKELWVLSPDAWSIPLDQPTCQKLVIVHNLDATTGATYSSLCSRKSNNGCGQCIMITEPREDYESVVPCLTKVTGEMSEICTVLLADIVLKTNRDQELESVSELSKALFESNNLQHVIVLKSTLPDTFYCNLFRSIRRTSNLRKLDFYFCSLPHTAVGLLSQTIPNLEKLTSLKLRRCVSKLCDAQIICKQIVYLQSLKHLDLSMNSQLGQCANILADSFLKWKDHPLEKLWVRECHIPAEQGKHFVKSLTNLRNLRVASLPDNCLNGAFSVLMSEAPPLEELYIWKTSLQTEDLLSIAAAIQNNKLFRLKRLHVERNNLTNNQVAPLLQQLNDNHSTDMMLDTSNNNLTKDFVEHWSSRTRKGLSVCWYLDKKY